MFIDATQLTQNRAPSDAGSVAIETAIKQQKEFEAALKLAQDRREAEAAAAERAKAEARRNAARVEAAAAIESGSADVEAHGEVAEPDSGSNIRGVSVDVEV